jgi:hypothetical protein
MEFLFYSSFNIMVVLYGLLAITTEVPHDETDLVAILVHGVLALFGSVMRDLNDLVTPPKSKSKQLKKKQVFIYNGLVGAFVGITGFFLFKSMGCSFYLTAFLSSLSGWIGGSLMNFFQDILQEIIRKRLGINKNDTEE